MQITEQMVDNAKGKTCGSCKFRRGIWTSGTKKQQFCNYNGVVEESAKQIKIYNQACPLYQEK